MKRTTLLFRNRSGLFSLAHVLSCYKAWNRRYEFFDLLCSVLGPDSMLLCSRAEFTWISLFSRIEGFFLLSFYLCWNTTKQRKIQCSEVRKSSKWSMLIHYYLLCVTMCYVSKRTFYDEGDVLISARPIQTPHRATERWKCGCVTVELNLQVYLILIGDSINGHMWWVAAMLGHTGVGGEELYQQLQRNL